MITPSLAGRRGPCWSEQAVACTWQRRPPVGARCAPGRADRV